MIDWYQLRHVGMALFGPPPASLVPVISHDEYVEAVRQHLQAWPDWVDGFVTRGSQAYAILTMCRGLRTWRTGEDASKREAARWACAVLPEYASLIQDAMAWRQQSRFGPRIDGTVTRDVTRRFVMDVQRLAEEGGRVGCDQPAPSP